MYSVVCFDNSEEVEVVPTQWPSRHVRLDFESQDPSPPNKQAFQNLPKTPAASGPSNISRSLLRDLLVNQQILMDQQKTMIRMIQDLHRSIQGGQKMSTTSSHTAYFPLGDELALEALEGDLASQRDLRQELMQ
ncbi:unnamed protein product [Gadus morhua 'NCC']